MISGLPFALPMPQALRSVASHGAWQSGGFQVGNQQLPVLEFSENFEGWSDDLTRLHEEAAGSDHPVDLASRRDALAQLKRYAGFDGAVVMEIGCSSGFMLKNIRSQMPAARLVGADVVSHPLQVLAQQLPDVPLLRFDLLRSPLPEACVDAIVMLNVLEHIGDDALALAQVARMLKPGGALILEVPAGSHLFDAYDAQLQHFRRYDAPELNAKVASAGLLVVRSAHLGSLIYPAFALVKRRNQSRATSQPGAKVVEAQARATSQSKLLRAAMFLEDKVRDRIPFTRGIRALVVARKPQ